MVMLCSAAGFDVGKEPGREWLGDGIVLKRHVGSSMQVVSVCLAPAVRMGTARGWLAGARRLGNR